MVPDNEQQWLSFSSGGEDAPNERGESRLQFPNTENKHRCKFFNEDQFRGHVTKMRKLNSDEVAEVKNNVY